MITQTLFQVAVAVTGSVGSALAALSYLRRVRLERPAVGTFNSRDLVVLSVFIVVLPVLYLMLPAGILTMFLVVTFLAALSITLRPLLPPRQRWPLIAGLLAANLVVTQTLVANGQGLQLYWTLTSVTVLLAAVGVSNLYVQGGLRLRQIAWFALFLAGYDAFFSLVVPLTQRLADAFEGQPLDPAIGFVVGRLNANIGLGDLLVYCMFTVAAYRGYGRRGATAALAVVGVFGALVPATVPLVVAEFTRAGSGIVVPAQAFFGPAAFTTYRWLRRLGPEQPIAAWASHREHGVQTSNQPLLVPTGSV